MLAHLSFLILGGLKEGGDRISDSDSVKKRTGS